MVELKRIYSLNIMAYIIANGIDTYQLVQDEEQPGKYYMVVEQDITEVKNLYKNDMFLQKYLQSFKILKKEIANRRWSV